MKKHISKLTVLLILFSALFVSCSGVIFYDIRKEVALDDAKISGDIKTIVRWSNNGTECVAVANGNIYYRSVESDVVDSKIDWTSLSKPANVKVEVLAADKTNLYAATILYEDDDDGYNTPTGRALYCYDGSSWTELYSASYSSTAFTLICTNTPQKANRHAYFRDGTTAVYELDGTTAVSDLTAMSTSSSSPDTEPTTGVTSCTVLGSTVYFSTANAMTSNETSSDASDHIYYCSGDTVLYSADGSSWSESDLNCDTILSLAVTSDYLLVGTDEGIAHTTWSSSGVPSSGTADFDTNADSTMSSYYEVQALLAVDPSKTETGGTLFSAIDTSGTSASLNNVGLWSYFASKGKWNRE